MYMRPALPTLVCVEGAALNGDREAIVDMSLAEASLEVAGPLDGGNGGLFGLHEIDDAVNTDTQSECHEDESDGEDVVENELMD